MSDASASPSVLQRISCERSEADVRREIAKLVCDALRKELDCTPPATPERLQQVATQVATAAVQALRQVFSGERSPAVPQS